MIEIRPGLGCSVLGAALCCLGAVGCTDRVAATTPRQVVRLATSSPDLLTAYSKLLPDMSFSVSTASTARSHLEALQHGRADVGASMADVTYLAYLGSTGEDDALDRLRGMVVLRPSTIHLVVRRGSSATTMADLRGQRVALGAPGSETAIAAKLLLTAVGLSQSDVHGQELAYPAALQALNSGDLDAMFVSGGYPQDLAAAATKVGARVLNVDGPGVERLRSEYPFLRRAFIPAGIYVTQPRAVYTVGVDTVLLCRADLDEELVYRLTKALVEALPFLSSKGTYFQNIDFKRMAATPIPLHPGAARYYRERELFQ